MFGISFYMFIRKVCCLEGVQGEKTDPEPMKKHEMHVIFWIRELSGSANCINSSSGLSGF